LEENKEVIIYPSKTKVLVLSLIALLFEIGIFFIVISETVHPTVGYMKLFCLKYIGYPFFGWGFVFGVSKFSSSKPALIINEAGIFDNASAIGVGLIRWSEISNVDVYDYSGQQYIGIIPIDLKKLLSRQGALKKFVLSINQKLYAVPINIPASILPMKCDKILPIIQTFAANASPSIGVSREKAINDSSQSVQGADETLSYPVENKHTNEEIIRSTPKIVIFSALLLLVSMVALFSYPYTDSNSRSSSNQNSNTVNVNTSNEKVTSLRAILANPTSYDGKKVIIGPLKATSNNLAGGYFDTCLSTGSGTWDYDVNTHIRVYYKTTDEKTKWENLDCSRPLVIYVYGSSNIYRDVKQAYVDAIEINETYKQSWAQFLSSNSGSTSGNQSTNSGK
jgi:hypothetical protein